MACNSVSNPGLSIFFALPKELCVTGMASCDLLCWHVSKIAWHVKILLHCNYLLPRFWQFFSLGSSRKLASSWMHSELTCLLFFRQLAHAKRHSRWEFILSEANTYPTWSKWCISIFWVYIYFLCGKATSLCSNLKSSIDAVTGSGCRHVNVCKGAHHCFPGIRASNHRRAIYVLWHHSAELSEREFLIS